MVSDSAFGALLTSTFLADLQLAREITLPAFQRCPLTARMVELAATFITRLL